MKEQSDTPRQTPLVELLLAVPEDARLIYEHSPTESQSIPVGPMCRQAAMGLATATRERDEARAEVEGLRSALGFYSQPVRYDGPNQRPIPGDQYTAADSAYMNDVCRDGGEIARAALAATEARPATPDGLPTYDKEKALEWVAQLRDGNKEAKP